MTYHFDFTVNHVEADDFILLLEDVLTADTVNYLTISSITLIL